MMKFERMTIKKIFLAIAVALPLSLTLSAQQIPSDVETRFLEYTDEMAIEGDKWAEDGCPTQANWFYGQAAAAVAGWRTAIAQMGIEIRNDAEKGETERVIDEAKEHNDEYSALLSDVLGEGVDFGGMLDGLMNLADKGKAVTEKIQKTSANLGERLDIHPFEIKDEIWYSVRSLCVASPYPDYFRGLVCDWRGDGQGALKYYGRAVSNPYFPGFEFDFSYLSSLSFQDLVALSKRLMAYQARYEGLMSSDPFHFEEDVPSWDAAALARTAADLLGQEATIAVRTRALQFYEAARHADPFNVTWTYLCALCHAQMDNGTAVAQCLNEALKMDAGNPRLQAGIAEWNAKIVTR